MNNNIKQFYEALVQLINSCNLPIGTAYFILKDLTHELQQGYEQAAFAESKQKEQDHTQIIKVPQPQEGETLVVPKRDIKEEKEEKEEKEDGSSNTVTENL